MIHFGFKRVAFQLPESAIEGVYPLRLSAGGVNHLNLFIVRDVDCLRLEPQKFAHLMYREKKLDIALATWCEQHGKRYRVAIGSDKTYRECVSTCMEMLKAIENKDQK